MRTLAFGVLAIALAGVFVRLGVWQLHRLEERKAANAAVRRALAEPPTRLTAEDAEPGAVRRLLWRRVEAAGRYDPSRERVVRGRAREGAPGVELLTPLEVQRGAELWVDRGWVPSPDAEHVDRRAYVERGRVRVRGFLRPLEKGEADPGEAPAAVLQQLPDPALPSPPFRRGGPELSNGPHLSYAIQWFAFAAIALVGFGAYLWSGRAGPPSHSPPEEASDA